MLGAVSVDAIQLNHGLSGNANIQTLYHGVLSWNSGTAASIGFLNYNFLFVRITHVNCCTVVGNRGSLVVPRTGTRTLSGVLNNYGTTYVSEFYNPWCNIS